MRWALAGFLYAAVYGAIVWMLGAHPTARLWTGDLALMVPPLATVAVVAARRRDWSGRQLVFWTAIAVGAALWFIGQVGWAWRELIAHQPLPWLGWNIVAQLTGSMMPLLALVAAPHRGARRPTAATSALDISGLALLAAYLCWMLAVAPGLAGVDAPLAVRVLATLGPAVRMAVVVGLLIAMNAAGAGAWRDAYGRIAIGATASFALLVPLTSTVFAGRYTTGSPFEAGWILPFWLYAWAASLAPSSEAEEDDPVARPMRAGAPILLFAAVAMVPVVRGLTRHLMPLPPPVDHYRDVATQVTVLAGLALAMWRVVVEQRAAARADEVVGLLAAATQQAAELIIIVSGRRIEYANDAFCRAVGYERRELTSLPATALVAPDVLDKVEAIGGQLDGGEPVRGTTRMRRRDGSTFDAAFTVAPMAGAAGSAPHLVAVVRDLTDELQLRDQLVRSERLSAAGELVSSIAHQINNPLQSVVGSVDLLLQRSADEALKADLERVRREAWRAGKIVRNLLTFVRKTPRERMLGELNDIAQATLALCRLDLASSGIQVRERYASDLPLVLVNREEIQQILVNLVTNAQQSLSAAGRGGTLTVTTYASRTDAVITIADDGPGVAPEIAARIFEPFNTSKDSGQATGFGLSTAFGIAAAHGGALDLVPVDHGACFRLTLPGAGFAGPVIHPA